MKDVISFRPDNQTLQELEIIKKHLRISTSDIVRMAISHFKNYVEKVNK